MSKSSILIKRNKYTGRPEDWMIEENKERIDAICAVMGVIRDWTLHNRCGAKRRALMKTAGRALGVLQYAEIETMMSSDVSAVQFLEDFASLAERRGICPRGL